MIIGVPLESRSDEHRVALTPPVVRSMVQRSWAVTIEAGAGVAAGYPDEAYREAGAEIQADRGRLFAESGVICQVRCYPANPEAGAAVLSLLTADHVVIGHCEPLTDRGAIERLAETGVTSLALELIPRITRAQAMDVLSSQANIAGYKAVILAATELPRMLPMLMTAAGTITAAKVFIIGAGVAGLQAIATARRLGAVVTAYDVRPAVREQVESLGASFLQLEVDTSEAEDKGGYAKALGDAVLQRQREQMAGQVADSDIIITTAAIPGKPAPVLIETEMLAAMRPGSVIVDLAAERGGNCEATRADERVLEHGVLVLGPTNLPGTVAYHASQVYARNLASFIENLVGKSDGPQLDSDDEIIQQTLLTRGGEIVQPRVREIFEMPPLQPVGEGRSAS